MKIREDATDDEIGTITINHVMSNSVKSRIFDDLLWRFQRYSPEWMRHVVSEKPISNADVFHYHRPNLESSILNGSVITTHHHLEDNDPWLEFANFAPRYREANRIICLCREQERWLHHRGFLNTVVIPHGVDDVFRAHVQKERRPLKVHLGLASRRYGRRVKGEAHLRELAKRLNPETFRFTLVGVGRTSDASMLHDFGFETAVYESLPYRLFPKFYNSIDGLLILSHYEGGPACIPEGVASATPIFTTPVGMGLDYIESGVNGEFFTKDPDADADILSRFGSDANYRTGMLKGAFQLSSNAVCWKTVVGRHAELYREISQHEL